MPRPTTSRALAPFGTTIFTTMTKLAQQHGAVNLSQGFPDFDGPDFVKDAAIKAMRDGFNQYAPMPGVPALRQAIAQRWKTSSGLDADPDTQITVTSGCTEAIAAALLGICDPGDEVILFEPFYDSYRACVAMAGAIPRFVTLSTDRTGTNERPDSKTHRAREDSAFTFDEAQLRAAFTPKTRAILINTPHNPTGKVFSKTELELIAKLCLEHNVIAITDEVYERLTFDAAKPHIHLASLGGGGMQDRTISLSSIGKTYSLTGWKIGWAIAPPELTKAVRSAHQFLTFATSTPFQHGAAAALTHGEPYVAELVAQYKWSRDYLATALHDLGFGVMPSDGTYFVMADHTPFGFKDDIAFCTHLTEKIKVAAIPPSVFYEHPEHGTRLVRFAFCKKRETLDEAVRRLQALRAT